MSALIALVVVLAWPTYEALACNLIDALADAPPAQTEKPRPDRDCHKRTDGQRAPSSKTCPDGGERLPQDRRSPLDSLPPLAPLVA